MAHKTTPVTFPVTGHVAWEPIDKPQYEGGGPTEVGRITEEGAFRVTEDGHFRITE